MENKEDQVIAIDGTTMLKTLCRNIKGIFYKIGDIKVKDSGHCYLINGKYYKFDTGYITYDYSIGEYVVKKVNELSHGIVGFSDKNTPVFGYFSKYPEYPVYVNYDNERYIILEESLLEGTSYMEDLTSCEYYHRNYLDAIRYTRPGNLPRNIKNNLSYDSRDITGKATKLYENLYTPVYSNAVEKYGNITKKLTFGLEFESSKGYIPTRITDKLGLIPLRDGSVEGLEYVTIPLKGKKGIQTIVDSVAELKKRTEFDDSCSLHLHIGGVPRTEEFFLALFKVLCMLQDQMFALFPLYKKYNYGVKRKHYTKPLPIHETMFMMDKVIDSSNIKSNFDVLYKFLSMGQPYSDVGSNLGNVDYHPSDPRGTSKWNIRSRYFWVNFVPLLFGNKKTIEFRIHTPTYDVNKVLNYLTMCTSIIEYTMTNTKAILANPELIKNLKLTDVVFTTVGEKHNDLADSIYRYICNRKDYIFGRTCQGDLVADESKFNYRPRISWKGVNSSSWLNASTYLKTAYNAGLEFRGEPIRMENIVNEVLND